MKLFAALAGLAGLGAGFAVADPIHIDFDTDAMGNPIQTGQVIDNEYAAYGVTITTENLAPGHPDLGIAFDSANPTGGDFDLRTPNPGLHPSNTVAYDNVLIIAEDAVFDMNGNVIDPDDEGRQPAGSFTFDMTFVLTEARFTLLDNEEPGLIQFFKDGLQVGTAPITPTADGAVQTIGFDAAQFNSFKVNLGGSGALADLVLVPEPGSLILLAFGPLVLRLRR
ncbi:MAG: PEP-CTERM sorting domain-containing protein [Phycisphaerales bacterium]|nr:PEP-CTERM sorting domain-containing protein [Phycisphaerales bacterium]